MACPNLPKKANSKASPMPKIRIALRANNLDSLAPGDYPDAMVPGLEFRIGKRRRTWTLRLTRPGGGQSRIIIGHYLGVASTAPASMTLSKARDAARAMLAKAEAGTPLVESVQHPKSSGITLDTALTKYEKYRRARGQRIKRLDETLRVIRNGLRAYLQTSIKEITKHDIRAVRDEIHARAPQGASRFLTDAGTAWKWFAAEDLAEHNIIASVLKIARPNKRKRVLSDEEISAIWLASFESNHAVAQTFGRLVRFLLLTGQRRGEAASMRFGDVLDSTWRQVTNKSDRPHSLKLPPLALAQLGEGGARDACFPSPSGAPLADFHRWRADLAERSGTSGWTLHDLRRSGASRLQDLGTDSMVIEMILNHAVPGVGGIYMRGTMEKQKAAALAKWAGEVERIVAAGRARLSPPACG